MLASASRAVSMDKIATEFISKQTQCNIVCIGCGLDTMAFRLLEFSQKAHFYEIDFPAVIQNRKTLLGVLANETLIEGNVNELEFSQLMNCTAPTLFVVAGVFQYFKEQEVIVLISKLQKQFNKAEILFDTTDEYGIKDANKMVRKTGNKEAKMYFYINDPKQFERQTNMKLLSATGFYDDISKELRKKLKLYTKIAMKIADKKKHTMIVRYDMNGQL